MGFCDTTHTLYRHNLIEVRGLLWGSVIPHTLYAVIDRSEKCVSKERKRITMGLCETTHSLCPHNLIEMRSVSLKREDYYGVL